VGKNLKYRMYCILTERWNRNFDKTKMIIKLRCSFQALDLSTLFKRAETCSHKRDASGKSACGLGGYLAKLIVSEIQVQNIVNYAGFRANP
jgi:hypothetical protein